MTSLMIAFFQKILFGGIESSVYTKNKAAICSSNLKTLRITSLFGSLAYFILTAVSLLFPPLFPLTKAYLVAALCMVVVYLLSKHIHYYKNSAYLLLFYTFFSICFALAIYIGAWHQVHLNATAFCVFMVALPLLIIDKPYRINLYLAGITIIYLFIITYKKEPALILTDTVNCIVFYLVAIFVNNHTIHTKLADIINRSLIEQERDTDSLTKLYNRGAAEQIIKNHLLLQRNTDAFMIIDLDNFKHINDSLGHAQGDVVLTELAYGLQRICRASDVVARFGGDEFIVFLPNIGSVKNVECRAGYILALLNGTLEQHYLSCPVTGSIGIALTGRDGHNYEQLFYKADVALYRAKKRGKNRYCFYDPAMSLLNYHDQTTDIDTPASEEDTKNLSFLNNDTIKSSDLSLQDWILHNINIHNTIAACKINLTMDNVDFLEEPGYRSQRLSASLTYSKMLQMISANIANTEEKDKFFTVFSLEAIINAHACGQDTISLEYRRTCRATGQIYWVNDTIHMIEDSTCGHLYFYGYLINIDEKKKIELELAQSAEKDCSTNAYSKDTFQQMVSSYLKYTNKKLNALLLLRISNYSDILRQADDNAFNNMLRQLYTVLEMQLGLVQIIGRIEDDTFAVLIADDGNKRWVTERVQNVIQILSCPNLFAKIDMPLQILSGIAFASGETDSFETLYANASEALSVASTQRIGDLVVFSDKPTNHQKTSVPPHTTDDFTYNSHLLLNLATELISYEDGSIQTALKQLGQYYSAACCLIFEVSSDNLDILCHHAWIAENFSLPKSLSLSNNSHIPCWLAALNPQQASVISCNNYSTLYPDEIEPLTSCGFSSLMVVPLICKEQAIGFLIICNPLLQQNNLALLDAAAHFFAGGLCNHRLQANHQYHHTHDSLTGLYNRESFQAYHLAFVSESLSSMGVVSVDINGLKQLNEKLGYRYGDSVVCFTAKTLEEIIKAGQVYRFDGDEFWVFCENIDHDIFKARCQQLQSAMCKGYNNSISVGYAWSDTFIDLDALMKCADQRRQIDKRRYYESSQNLSSSHQSAMLRELTETLEKDYYRIYLQPKALLQSHKVVGAEALSRLHHPKYGLLCPDKYIHPLEDLGAVHYLDLFMFRKVCQALVDWEKRGLPLMVISLNFSRLTLLQQNIVDTMEAIRLEYGIPAHWIEIEITESYGHVERDELASICRKIIQKGYHLSLDDFGTMYSNLSILSALPLNTLKIDRTIACDIVSNESTRIIVKSLIDACHALQIEVVTEGIETEDQLKALCRLGCDFGQGYYFNKAITLQDFETKYLSALEV